MTSFYPHLAPGKKGQHFCFHLLKLFDSVMTESARNGDGELDKQSEVVVLVLCVINIEVSGWNKNNLTLWQDKRGNREIDAMTPGERQYDTAIITARE